MWGVIGKFLLEYGTAIAGVAAVAGTGYGIYASEDSKRKQSNAIKRAEAQQAASLEAAKTQEEVFSSLQNLNGNALATDLSQVAKDEQTKRLWIYGAIALALVALVWFVIKKKKRK